MKKIVLFFLLATSAMAQTSVSVESGWFNDPLQDKQAATKNFVALYGGLLYQATITANTTLQFSRSYQSSSYASSTLTHTLPTCNLSGTNQPIKYIWVELSGFGTSGMIIKAPTGDTLDGTSAGSNTYSNTRTRVMFQCISPNTWISTGDILEGYLVNGLTWNLGTSTSNWSTIIGSSSAVPEQVFKTSTTDIFHVDVDLGNNTYTITSISTGHYMKFNGATGTITCDSASGITNCGLDGSSATASASRKVSRSSSIAKDVTLYSGPGTEGTAHFVLTQTGGNYGSATISISYELNGHLYTRTCGTAIGNDITNNGNQVSYQCDVKTDAGSTVQYSYTASGNVAWQVDAWFDTP